MGQQRFGVEHLAIVVDDQRLNIRRRVLVGKRRRLDDASHPTPVRMCTQHADHLSFGIVDWRGEIDEAQRLAIGQARQQLGQQHCFMGIAGVLPAQADLKPRAFLHRLTDQQIIDRLAHITLGVSDAHPRIFGARLGAQLHRLEDGWIVQIATLQMRRATEQIDLQLPLAQLLTQQRRRRARRVQQRVAAGLFHLFGGDVTDIKADAQ